VRNLFPKWDRQLARKWLSGLFLTHRFNSVSQAVLRNEKHRQELKRQIGTNLIMQDFVQSCGIAGKVKWIHTDKFHPLENTFYFVTLVKLIELCYLLFSIKVVLKYLFS